MRKASLVIWAVAAIGCTRVEPPAPAPKPKVVVAPVVQRSVQPEVTLLGTVVAYQSARVASTASGPVVWFPHRPGTFVKKGQVLARLRTTDVELQLQAAQALEKQRRYRYEELRRGFLPEEIQQAKALLERAKARLQLAQSRFQRAQALFRSGTINQEEFDQIRTELHQAQQDVIAQEAEYQLKLKGYPEEQIQQAKAAWEAQREEVRRLEDELTKRTITAPFDGYLVEKLTEPGEWVHAGDPVALLINLDIVEAVVPVDESYLELVQVGSRVQVWADALSGPLGSFQGQVVQVVPRAQWEQASRSFPVRVRIANRRQGDQPVLKEGMLVRVRFTGPKRQALLVPKDAVVRSAARPVVFVLDQNNRVQAVPFQEGQAFDSWVEVRSGELSAQALVVTEGAERLRSFMQVEVVSQVAPDSLAQCEENASEDASDSSQLRGGN